MNKISSQKGQAVTEAILIMLVSLGISALVANGFKNNDIVRNLVSGPWVAISSMIANGNWDVKNSKNFHPNYHDRHVTHSGKKATVIP